MEIVLYTQLALAKIQQGGRGDGFLSLKELNGKRQEMLLRYERLYGAYSGHVEDLRQAWEKSIPSSKVPLPLLRKSLERFGRLWRAISRSLFMR